MTKTPSWAGSDGKTMNNSSRTSRSWTKTSSNSPPAWSLKQANSRKPQDILIQAADYRSRNSSEGSGEEEAADADSGSLPENPQLACQTEAMPAYEPYQRKPVSAARQPNSTLSSSMKHPKSFPKTLSAPFTVEKPWWLQATTSSCRRRRFSRRTSSTTWIGMNSATRTWRSSTAS